MTLPSSAANPDRIPTQVREWEESLEGPVRSSSLSSSEGATSLSLLTRRYSLEAATTTAAAAAAPAGAEGGAVEGGVAAAVGGSAAAPARLQPRKSLEAELFALDL